MRVAPPDMDGVGVSIVIATRDRPAMLAALVESLGGALRPNDEVIVVDSASRDRDASAVAERAGYRVIRVAVPGASKARNAGWRAAVNGLVAFTDDDCAVSAGWTAAIAVAFEDPSVGFVTGSLIGDRDAAIGTATVVDPAPRRVAGPSDPSLLGSGANMAFRRSVLEEIGGFDEEMGPGTRLRAAEDHDAFARALGAGWVGAYEPGIRVTHRLWRSRRQAIAREFSYGVGAGVLASKMVRTSGVKAHVLRRVWREGPAKAARDLARGYESGAVAAIVKSFGLAVGYARASRFDVVDGMLRSRG